MNAAELRSLIRETLAHTWDVDQLKLRTQQLQQRDKPRVATLGQQEKVAAVQELFQLPEDRKELVKAVMRRPCSECEQQFHLPNIGWSHGVCYRHREAFRAQLAKRAGQPYQPSPEPANSKNSVDMQKLTPEELRLCAKLFAIAGEEEKGKTSSVAQTPSTP